MKIASVSIVRDECDIIESFVRRNLQFFDVMYVVVHRSIDGSREIVAALRDEGLPVRAFEDPGEGFNQAERTNRLARMALSEGADFVFPIDADEILAAASREQLEAVLRTLPMGGAGGVFPWETYVPLPSDSPGELCPVRRIGHRYDTGPRWDRSLPHPINLEACKVVVGRWFASEPRAWIFDGNHVVFVGEALSVVPLPGIRYAHFPCRTLDQLANKCVLGWIACLASASFLEKSGVASHWKRIYERVSAGEGLAPEDLREFLRSYAPEARPDELIQDLLPSGDYTIRYAGLRRPRKLLPALLETTERLARATAPKRVPR